jgi:hypothetical protein
MVEITVIREGPKSHPEVDKITVMDIPLDEETLRLSTKRDRKRPTLYTISAIAKKSGLKVTTVWKLVDEGQLPSTTLPGGGVKTHKVVPAQPAEEFIKSKKKEKEFKERPDVIQHTELAFRLGVKPDKLESTAKALKVGQKVGAKKFYTTREVTKFEKHFGRKIGKKPKEMPRRYADMYDGTPLEQITKESEGKFKKEVTERLNKLMIFILGEKPTGIEREYAYNLREAFHRLNQRGKTAEMRRLLDIFDKIPSDRGEKRKIEISNACLRVIDMTNQPKDLTESPGEGAESLHNELDILVTDLRFRYD